MTQELFTKAILGVVKQGCLSKAAHQVCYYRHPKDPNIRCAIGHLISDDDYHSEMEGNSAEYLELSFKLPDWAEDLQCAHDSSDTIYGFIYRARIVAAEHGLIMPI